MWELYSNGIHFPELVQEAEIPNPRRLPPLYVGPQSFKINMSGEAYFPNPA